MQLQQIVRRRIPFRRRSDCCDYGPAPIKLMRSMRRFADQNESRIAYTIQKLIVVLRRAGWLVYFDVVRNDGSHIYEVNCDTFRTAFMQCKSDSTSLAFIENARSMPLNTQSTGKPCSRHR